VVALVLASRHGKQHSGSGIYGKRRHHLDAMTRPLETRRADMLYRGLGNDRFDLLQFHDKILSHSTGNSFRR